jgi:tryptophan synthase alpha chain
MPINFPNRPGIVAYLTAGDPDLATTREIALAAIDNGADVLELGVPFSDPLADGPVIQRASERAVARGVRLTDVLALAKDLRKARPSAGLVLFSYLNPVVKLGMQPFCEQAAAAGIDGVLLTDMIVEEAAEYLEAMHAHRLSPIFLAAPTSPDKRLKAIAEASRGFVYAISRVGITGTQKQIDSDAQQLVQRLRAFTQPAGIPIAVGFGISTPEQVAAVGQFADAAIVGSALVQLIERSSCAEAPAAVGRFIASLRQQQAAASTLSVAAAGAAS